MMIKTNMGSVPVEDYKEIVALQNGYDSYEEMTQEGFVIDLTGGEECD